MVNTGKPSTGCGRCRQRRVKCDEQKVACRNCLRVGKPCPGYPNAKDLVFRRTVFPVPPTSSYRSSHNARQIPPVPIVDPKHPSEVNDLADSIESSDFIFTVEKTEEDAESPVSVAWTLSLVPFVGDVENQIVCFSLNSFERNSRIFYKNPSFEFLPDLLEKSDPDSCLRRAMAATAFADFANRYSTEEIASKPRQEYLRAINATNAALQDPHDCLKDETLMAVWMLGMFEITENFNPLVDARTRFSPGLAPGFLRQCLHGEGVLALLRARGDSQFSTPIGGQIFRAILAPMSWYPLFFSQEQSANYVYLESLLHRTGAYPPASIRLRSYFRQVVSLRAKIKIFLDEEEEQPSSDPSNRIGEFMHAAKVLDSSIDDWCDVPDWCPVQMATKERDESAWSTPEIFMKYYFTSFAAFYHWNRFYMAHLTLHQAILNVLHTNRASVKTDDLIRYHTNLLQNAAGNFLGQVGYAFGEIDECGNRRASIFPRAVPNHSIKCYEIHINGSLQMFPPLSYLQQCQFITSKQREATRIALEQLRDMFRARPRR